MSAYLLLLSLLLPTSIAIETTGCGSAKNCVQFPNGCSPTSADCLYFTYAWDSSANTFTMELSGSTGGGSKYVAVGFAQTGEMKDADVYYCTGNELKSAAIGTLRSQPVVDTSLPTGVTSQSSMTNGGVAECLFTRPASVTKTVSNGAQAFDLSTTSHFILLATGDISSGALAYHGPSPARWPSPSSYNFTAITTSTTPAATPTPATTTTTPGSSDNSAASGCGETKGCFRNPSGCTPGTSGCMFVSWKYDANDNKFEFEMLGQPGVGYAAVAFGASSQMQDADMYYCTASSLFSGAIQTFGQTPATDTALPPEITDSSVSSSNGVITCSFKRAPSVTKTVSGGRSVPFNLATTNYYVLLADGPFSSGGGIQYHSSSRKASSAAQNFTAISEASGGGTSLRESLIKAHASLMLIAWMTCASIGVLIARHFKPLFHGQSCFKNKVWFQMHRALMITAVLATIVGFILVFAAQKDFSRHAGAHPYIGIVVTALAIANPVMAIFRPHPGTSNRSIFNWGHWFVGSSARILGITAIFLGVDLSGLDLPEWDTWVMVGFVAFHIVTEIILEIISACYGHIDAYKKKKLEDVDNKDTNGRPPRGSAIKYFIMLLYSLGNLAFLLTFIVAIAQN